MRLLMLGCGTSSGVPRLGGPDGQGNWGACDPANPRNRRHRCSVLIEAGETRLLVDTSPDLRDQLLGAGIGWISAALFTHDHADHCHGIDDLRQLFHASGKEIPCYMDRETRAGIRSRFSYVFAGRSGYPAIAEALVMPEELQIGPISVRAFRQQHGPVHSLGFRFTCDGKSIAYSTDLNGIPGSSWPLVADLDLWVVDALRREPHPTHSHLAQTLEWIAQASPKEAWLTHMDQSMDYEELARELPAGVSPGYDGRVWNG